MEKELKYELQKLSSKEQEEVRKKIVRQMMKHGNAREVAEICECTVRHVNNTWKKYKEGGVKAISAIKKGRPKGKGCKLTVEQGEIIKKLITEKTPEETGLSGHLWSRAEVSEIVKRKFGVEMPVRTMGHYLAKWNFTAQRPKKKITGKTQKKKKNGLKLHTLP
jgi:transposase